MSGSLVFTCSIVYFILTSFKYTDIGSLPDKKRFLGFLYRALMFLFTRHKAALSLQQISQTT